MDLYLVPELYRVLRYNSTGMDLYLVQELYRVLRYNSTGMDLYLIQEEHSNKYIDVI